MDTKPENMAEQTSVRSLGLLLLGLDLGFSQLHAVISIYISQQSSQCGFSSSPLQAGVALLQPQTSCETQSHTRNA